MMQALLNRKFAVPILLVLGTLGGLFAGREAIIQYNPVVSHSELVLSIQVAKSDALLLDQKVAHPFVNAAYQYSKPTHSESTVSETALTIKLEYESIAEAERNGLLLKDVVSGLLSDAEVRVDGIDFDVRGKKEERGADFVFHLLVNDPARLFELKAAFETAIRSVNGLEIRSVRGVPEQHVVLTLKSDVASNPEMVAAISSDLRRQFAKSETLELTGRHVKIVSAAHEKDVFAALQNMRISIVEQHIPLHRLVDIETEWNFSSQIEVNGKPALSITAGVADGDQLVRVFGELQAALDALKANPATKIDYVIERNAAEKLQNDVGGMVKQVSYALLTILLVSLVFYRSLKTVLVLIVVMGITYAVSLLLFSLVGLRIDLLTLLALAMTIGIMIDNVVISLEQVQQRDSKENGSSSTLLVLISCNATTLAAFLPLFLLFKEYASQIEQVAIAVGTILLVSVLVSVLVVGYLNTHIRSVSLPPPSGVMESFWRSFVRFRRKFRWVLVIALVLFIGLPVQIFKVPFDFPGYDTYRLFADYLGGVQVRLAYKLGNLYPEAPPNDWNYLRFNVSKPYREGIETWKVIQQSVDSILASANSTHTFYSLEKKVGSFEGRLAYDTAIDSLSGWLVMQKLHGYFALLGNAQGSVTYLNGNGPFSNAFHDRRGSPTIELTGYDYRQLEFFARKAAKMLDESGMSDSKSTLGEPAEHYFPEDVIQLRTKTKNGESASVFEAAGPFLNSDFSFFSGNGIQLVLRNQSQPNWMKIDKAPRNEHTAALIQVVDSANFTRTGSITQKDRKYLIWVYADIWDPMQIFSFIEKLKLVLNLPGGYSVGYPGFGDSMKRTTFADAMIAVGVLLFLIFCMNAFALNDWQTGFNTMLVMLLTILAAGFYLVIENQHIRPAHVVGLMLTLGLVVNAVFIVQKEYVEARKKGGVPLESWALAFSGSFRPIIISLITTFFGLLPFAVSNGQQFWTEFARTVLFCLPFSTGLLFLTTGLFAGEEA